MSKARSSPLHSTSPPLPSLPPSFPFSQAARVFLEVAQACSTYKPTNLVPIGEATGMLLKQAGAGIKFTPSKALAKVLAVELPEKEEEEEEGKGGGRKTKRTARVLYPASKRAAHTLEDGLHARGVCEAGEGGREGEREGGRRLFDVTRLNTYDTVPAEWSEADEAMAKACRVVTFASPSALKVWASRVGMEFNVACIGETTATAARQAGWKEERIFYPREAPGIEGWAAAVGEALRG